MDLSVPRIASGGRSLAERSESHIADGSPASSTHIMQRGVPLAVRLSRRAFSATPKPAAKAAPAPAKTAAAPGLRNVVLVDGCRIPFQPAMTTYKNLVAYDLARLALTGLLTKSGMPPAEIEYILMGTVIQEAKNANIARDAALGAGIPHTVPAHTVTQACISSNQAICSAISAIQCGQYDVVVAGGVETFSDVPIRFSKKIRERMLKSQKAKGAKDYLKLLKGLGAKDLAPDLPAIANFTTGEVMGKSCDRLADKFGVTRSESDEFALASHLNAAKAHADGIYDDEVVPYEGSRAENGIRADNKLDKMAGLKAAFVKPFGTVTAANASFLTDGASATLLMAEETALARGYKPKAYLRNWAFVSCDPFEEMLLGPAYAATKVLRSAGLGAQDLDVIEFHEAFAGQVLANLKALDSQKWCARAPPDSTAEPCPPHLHPTTAKPSPPNPSRPRKIWLRFDSSVPGGGTKIGAMDMSKFNKHGGSLSIGHPFGATGARLVTTVANRLQREGGRFGLVAACADGGIGHAALVERYPN